MKDRYANLAHIRALDPQRDFMQIYQLMLRYEFPWDFRLGLNLAFNRSFCIPHVAAVLAGTGELIDRTQRRIDDTGILMYEIALNGFDHPRSREAIRRINQIHRRFTIANDDNLYVLACLGVLPIRWLERYGWRRPCCHERSASYLFCRELGRRMNITDIPDSYPALEAFLEAYDAVQLRYSDHGAAIERATRMLMLSRIPRPLAPLGDALVAAVYDERLRRATGVPRPALPVRVGFHLGLKARAGVLRWFGKPRTEALFADGIRTATYPDGYDISRLGPEETSPAGLDSQGG